MFLNACLHLVDVEFLVLEGHLGGPGDLLVPLGVVVGAQIAQDVAYDQPVHVFDCTTAAGLKIVASRSGKLSGYTGWT